MEELPEPFSAGTGRGCRNRIFENLKILSLRNSLEEAIALALFNTYHNC
jgi:hypothetical protein